MKIKFNKDKTGELASYLIYGSLVLVPFAGWGAYLSYENVEEISDNNFDYSNFNVDEEGKITQYFDVGEHKIKISRNDAYYRKIEKVEGYEIEKVTVSGWRDNNQVVYVNKIPVLAQGTIKNGKVSFENFGQVVEEKELVK